MSRTLRPADFVYIYAATRDALIIAAYRAARNRGTLVQGVTAPAVEDRILLETVEYGELIAYIFPGLVLIYGPAGFTHVSEGEGIEVEDDSLDDPMFEDDDEDSGDDNAADMTADDWDRFHREADGEEDEQEEEDEEDDGYVECAVCRHAIGSTAGCRDCQNYNETKDDEDIENDEEDAIDAYIADGEAAGARAEDWDEEDLVEEEEEEEERQQHHAAREDGYDPENPTGDVDADAEGDGGYVDADDVWYGEANLQTAAPVHSPYTGTGLLFTGTIAELLGAFAQLAAAKDIDETMDRMAAATPALSGVPRLYGALCMTYPGPEDRECRPVVVYQSELPGVEPLVCYANTLEDACVAFDACWGGEFDNWVIEGEFYPTGHAKNLLQCPLVVFTFGRHGNRKES